MAERRMFSKAVVNSARFLRMPQTSRLLYYDLGMAADDDGIVEAFAVIRTTGAAEDDLRVLASKGFVRVLNEDLVSYISDWKRNNFIRTDRYRPSAYAELLVKITDGDRPEDGLKGGPESGGIPMVDQRYTQIRLGKDRLNTGESIAPPDGGRAARFTPPTVEDVAAYCRERGNSIDPERFVDFYTSKGWKVGNQKMKDWKAAVRNWERRPEYGAERNRGAGRDAVKTAADYEGGDDFLSWMNKSTT